LFLFEILRVVGRSMMGENKCKPFMGGLAVPAIERPNGMQNYI
jgi:hypothetical protein